MKNEKFNFKKVFQYINKEESQFNLLKNFFKNTLETERKNQESIDLFGKQVREASSGVNHKALVKMVNNFGIHKLESQQSSQMAQLIAEKINYWLQELSVKYTEIKQKCRNMERHKDPLTDIDIESYKKELRDEMTAVTRKKQSVLQLYSYTQIKNNSQQIETITSTMQNEIERGSMVHKK